eukprot:jgi/Tetstr1/436990/TSEL_025762.t1
MATAELRVNAAPAAARARAGLAAGRAASKRPVGRSVVAVPRRAPRHARMRAGAAEGGEQPVRYLYDGECPLRKPEVEMLKRLDDGKGRIEFVDISPMDYDPSQNAGITYEEAMGKPAAILADGTVVRSLEVYRTLYEAVGLGFVWAAAELPLVGRAVEWVFDRTVEYRLLLTRRPPLEQLVAERSGAALTDGQAAAVSGDGSASITEEADTFLASPGGKFVSWLGNTITASPLNEGKVRLARLQAGGYDPALARAKMEGLIASEKVVVFSFSTCPFCVKAKGLLEELGVEYAALELDEMGKEGYAIRAELAQDTGRTSMPNIWIDGQSIGGCNDGPGLLALHREGKLAPMLEAAGVLARSA